MPVKFEEGSLEGSLAEAVNKANISIDSGNSPLIEIKIEKALESLDMLPKSKNTKQISVKLPKIDMGDVFKPAETYQEFNLLKKKKKPQM